MVTQQWSDPEDDDAAFVADEVARIAALHKSAPEVIWLQVDPEAEQFDGWEAQTWCSDKINATDVKYVRADLTPNPQVCGGDLEGETMTDDIKSLLIDAAKAAGIEGKLIGNDFWISQGYYLAGLWNPLIDDGDSARLRTTLEMDAEWYFDGHIKVAIYLYGKNERVSKGEYATDHNGDKNAALRAATLRLAAEIGRRMP